MKIALFLNYENLEVLNKNTIQAYTFNVENSIITGMINETMSIKNIHYLCLWLMSKNIEVVYANCLTPETKVYLENIGITIKSIDEIKDNPLLKSFLI